MAEVAGLVIGGISMAALVDGCMKTFDRIESARTYGRDYQKATLKLALLQLRLSRWVEGVVEITKGQHLVRIGTSDDAAMVQTLLGDIIATIERTEGFSRRYHDTTASTGQSQEDKNIITMEMLSQRVKTLALDRQKSSTVSQKARWALRDQRKFTKLLGNLTESISELEDLFPADRFPALAGVQKKLALTEASDLIQPSGIEEPDDDDATIVVEVLDDAACDVDETLKEALESATRKTEIGRHVFGETNFAEGTRVLVGDYVAQGNKANGVGHVYGTMTVSGTSRVHYGNNYGGKSVFDD